MLDVAPLPDDRPPLRVLLLLSREISCDEDQPVDPAIFEFDFVDSDETFYSGPQ